jgi:hypothetical protein
MANPETCGNIGYKNGQSRDMWQHWVQEWPIQRHVATLDTHDTGRRGNRKSLYSDELNLV